MSIDLDLSSFRLVKSFAAVEISKNVGTSGPDEGVRQSPADAGRQQGAILSPTGDMPGQGVVQTRAAPTGHDRIPDRLDDDMRASLDQRLEGAERAAVSWQPGQRNAALSLSGLARPGVSPENRLPRGNGGADQAAAHESGPADQPISRPNAGAAQAEDHVASTGQAADSKSPHVASGTRPALPAADGRPRAAGTAALTVPAGPATHAIADPPAVAGTADPSGPAGGLLGTADPVTRKQLVASAMTLFGETRAVDVLQSMIESQAQPKKSVTLPEAGRTAGIEPDTADDAEAPNVAAQDLKRLSRPAVTSVALAAEQAEVTDRRWHDEALPANRRGSDAPVPARTGTAMPSAGAEAVSSRLAETAPGQRADGAGPVTVPEAARDKSGPSGPDGDLSALAAHAAGTKAAATVIDAKVIDILNALVAMSPAGDDGSADWPSLSSVILNAAMIPGWPPPRPLENPAGVKDIDRLAQMAMSPETEEAAMTPEQMLAYLVSIGANLRLLRALQELMNRVEKKNGPALLAWLTGLVSALKMIEKSLKDIIEEGMELPDWLAELAEKAKGPRRRKQFHI